VKQLLFHPQAEEELEGSARYYESRGKGLGHRFLFEVEKGLSCILAQPDAWPPLVYQRIRRYLLHYFPYAIIYRNDAETLFILSIMHLARKPGYWRSRKRT
jgi:toxin ParE1/3/4